MTDSPGRDRRWDAVAAVAVVGLAVGLRLWYLWAYTNPADPVVTDPDFYLPRAARLVETGRWQWTLKAIDYRYDILFHLSPLYPVFLSLFAGYPGHPFTAAAAQAVLGGITAGLVVWLGAVTHTLRAGLVAGLAYAVWLPGVSGATVFMQEQVHVPLLVAGFALVAGALARGTAGGAMVAGGIVVGLAALARSMPAYFVVLVGATWWWRGAPGSLARRQVVALVAGFAVAVLPYSAFISWQLGKPVLIEDRATISATLHIPEVQPHVLTGKPLTLPDGLALWARAAWGHPTRFASSVGAHARALFHPSGGRWLTAFPHAHTASEARAWKVASHATIDVPLLLAATLAPFGVLLAREAAPARLLAGWILFSVAASALGAFGGARYRWPFEPHLLVLGAVALTVVAARARTATRRPAGAGPRIPEVALAAALSVVLFAAVASQLAGSLRLRANYGLALRDEDAPNNWTAASGRAGLMLLTPRPGTELVVVPPRDAGGGRLRVAVNGHAVVNHPIGEGAPIRLRRLWPERVPSYVELAAERDGHGLPFELQLSASR